jgi:chemotaxis methyl-accepting protein methylase
MDQNRVTQDVDERGFDAFLDFVKRQRGLDLAGYKRTGLMRRARRRMAHTGIDGFEAYREYLRRHPDEYTHLFDAVLINVTGFFRDPDAWNALAARVLPGLAAADASPLRVWSAGCSTGEEPYTLVMLLAEQMGWDEARSRVRIYATDMDESALQQARTAVYEQRAVDSVPPPLLERYFDPVEGRFAFTPQLRRCVIFGRNDLARDPPISRLKLLVCRNTLMYFTVATQTRILSRFHSALDDDGVLFLGRPEMLLTRSTDFAPIDLRNRIFARVPGARGHVRLPVTARGEGRPAEELHAAREELETTREELRTAVEQLETTNDELHGTNEELRTINDELRRRTEQLNRMSRFMSAVLASLRIAVVLDGGLRVRLWTEHAREVWGLRADEVEGEPFFSLDIDPPTERLRDAVRRCLEGNGDIAPVVLQAGEPRGREFRCRVRRAGLAGVPDSVQGVILMMEESTMTEAVP